MSKLAHALFYSLLLALPSRAQTTEHLYAPETNLERSELARLETATRSVDIAMYSFTYRYIAEELASLARKGYASACTATATSSNRSRSTEV